MPDPTIRETQTKPLDQGRAGQRGSLPQIKNPPFEGKRQLCQESGESAPLKGVYAFAMSSWAQHDLEEVFPGTQGQGRHSE